MLIDLIENFPQDRAKKEHPVWVIKQKFDYQQSRLRVLAKNRCKVYEIAAMTNLFLVRRLLSEPLQPPESAVDPAAVPASAMGWTCLEREI